MTNVNDRGNETMTRMYLSFSALALGSWLAVSGCSSTSSPSGQGSSDGGANGDAALADSGSPSDGAGPDLHRYLTCGDPVCPAPTFDAGVETEGGVDEGV
jgi:hypothetical protein